MKNVGRRACKDERGIALPVALMMMVLVSGLAVVSARAAVGTQHQTLRDSNAKRAIQAAAAGVEAATYQMNLLQPPATQCVIRTAAGLLMLSPVGTDGWCATQTEDLGDGTDYTFRVSSATVTAGNGQNLVAAADPLGWAQERLQAPRPGDHLGLGAGAAVRSELRRGEPRFDRLRQQHRGPGRSRVQRQHRAAQLR